MARQLQISAILLVFFQEIRGDGKASSCNIPPAEVGGIAVLTCKFDTYINETKDSFQVERYSTAKKKQESLVACQWISDKLECDHLASLRFDRNITNTFQVVIPLVTSDDFGEYVCYVLPTPNGKSKRCYLTRRVAHSKCEASAALKGSVATVTCIFDSDISKLRQDFEVLHVPVNDYFADVVLLCHWSQDETLCKRRQDYQLDSPVTRQFTVKITEVGNRHAGKFICKLVSHDPGTYEYCELVLTESQTSTFPTLLTTKLNSFNEVSTRSVRHNVDTSGISILNGNGSDQHKELTSPLSNDSHGNSLAIALPITAVLMITAICVILLKYKKEFCNIVFKRDQSANQNPAVQHLITDNNLKSNTPC